MKKNRLLIYLFLIVSALLFFLGQESVALAATDAVGSAQAGLDAAASVADLKSETDAIELAGTIVKTILSFLGIIFIVLMLYAGFMRMTAQGDAKKVETSTAIIRSAIIGIIIIFVSYIVTVFVIEKLTEVAGGDESSGSQDGNYTVISCCVSSSSGYCVRPSTSGGRGLECPDGYTTDNRPCTEIGICDGEARKAECKLNTDCSSCGDPSLQPFCNNGTCGCVQKYNPDPGLTIPPNR